MSPADYRADPRWRAANADYLSDLGEGEAASQAFMRRATAAAAMALIEREYELDGPGVVVGVDAPGEALAAAPPATSSRGRLSVDTDQDVRAPGSPARQPARARTSTSRR